MAGSFFGFSTELPHSKDKLADLEPDDELGHIREDSEIDLLNDETFGAASLDTSWADKQTDLSQFIHAQLHNSPGKQNKNKDLSLSEAFIIDDEEEEEEEEEIIEKTILQLGLDDDQDDVDYSGKSKDGIQDKQEDWTSPPRKSNQGNSLLDLLSPDRDIWASPSPSSSVGSRNADAKVPERPDVIQKLFNHEGKPGRGVSLDSVPLPPLPQHPPPAQAMTLEELEKSLVKEKRTKEAHMPHVTIIEKRALETPGPPPGFMLPLSTPPSGLPMQTPFGMRMNRERPLLPQISPLWANSFPLGFSPLPGMSPLMTPGFPFPPRFGPMATPGLMMPNGRRQDTPFPRGSWRHPPSRFQNRPRGHYQERPYHDREFYNAQGKEEESLNLPPSVLMTSKDKEWIVKIQLMQLMSEDPYATDYYHMKFLERKAEGSWKKEAEDLEKTKKIVEKHLEGRDYKPATFEGSLGKLSCSSVHHPRQLMDVAVIPSELEKKNNEGSKRRFLIYGLIEKNYEILLTLEDIERRRKAALDSDRLVFDQERQRRVERIFRLMRLRLHTESPMTDEDFEVFLLMLNVSKGKKLLAALLPVLNQLQAESTILHLLKGLPVLARKDFSQELSSVLETPMLRVVISGSPDFLTQVRQLMISKIAPAVLSTKFGVTLCSACAQRLTMLSEEDETLQSLRIDFAKDLRNVISSLPEKKKERHKLQLGMLERVLAAALA